MRALVARVLRRHSGNCGGEVLITAVRRLARQGLPLASRRVVRSSRPPRSPRALRRASGLVGPLRTTLSSHGPCGTTATICSDHFADGLEDYAFARLLEHAIK
jgi:hypothetical protein